jgi:hypothetical protein
MENRVLIAFQSVIRIACRDERLDLAARMHLLELIELRAMNWITNDKVSSYYRLKLAEVRKYFWSLLFLCLISLNS